MSLSGIECAICLQCSSLNRPWAACLCGHVFHEACLHKAFERKQACPTCRAPVDGARPGVEARNGRRAPPLQIVKLFLGAAATERAAGEASSDDEGAAGPPPAAGAGAGGAGAGAGAGADADTDADAPAEPALVAELRSQIASLRRGMEQQSQSLGVELREERARGDALAAEVAAQRARGVGVDARLSAALQDKSRAEGELARTASRARTLELKLKEQKAEGARARLAHDPRLAGADLAAAIRDVEAAGGPAQPYFLKLLEDRNAALTRASTRADRAERELAALENEARRRERAAAAVAAAAAAAVNEAEARARYYCGEMLRMRDAACAAPPSSPAAAARSGSQPAAAPPRRAASASAEEDDLEVELDDGDLSDMSALDSDDDAGAAGAGHAAVVAAAPVGGAARAPLPPPRRPRQALSVGHPEENDPLLAAALAALAPPDYARAAAGPSRAGMAAAPGPSFIRDAAAARTGLGADGAHFLRRVPDGRGGLASAYGGRAGAAGAGAGACPRPRAGAPAAKRQRAAAPPAIGLKISNYYDRGPPPA